MAPANPRFPAAPTALRAVPGEASATVSWSAPATDGGSPITGYHVTASPGGASGDTVGGVTALLMTDLTNGTRYTFTVAAENAIGRGPVSVPSNPVRPGEDMPKKIFVLDIIYVVVLVGLAILYAKLGPDKRGAIPPTVASVPISIPWFGALGAVTIGLYGVFWHNDNDWQRRYNLWHYARPITGAILGLIGYLIYIAIIRSAVPQVSNEPPHGAAAASFFVVAFIVGYREEVFQNLIARAIDALLNKDQQSGSRPPSSSPPANWAG